MNGTLTGTTNPVRVDLRVMAKMLRWSLIISLVSYLGHPFLSVWPSAGDIANVFQAPPTEQQLNFSKQLPYMNSLKYSFNVDVLLIIT